VVEGANKFSADNAVRAGKITDAVQDSPTRVNVLDNIINLSKAGVGSGPTSEWVNSLKGPVAQITGNQKWTDDVAGFQELKKFMNQNANRAWQAAGGTGSDAQLEAAQNANVNDKMFPQAVQQIAQWAKGGELALQAKNTAQTQWLKQNGNNPANQNLFEQDWMKSYDPLVYQAAALPPGERRAFVQSHAQSDPKLMYFIDNALQKGYIK
jgi:hypothetical protein